MQPTSSSSCSSSLLWTSLILLMLYANSAACLGLPDCSLKGLPLVRNISRMRCRDFQRLGLSHLSVSTKVHHGNKQLEVWLQAFAPGTRTPIHRHDCEEVFVVLKGKGLLLRSTESSVADVSNSSPGAPEVIPFQAQSTFTVPPLQVHQILNENTSSEPLQFYVFISRPPVKIDAYTDWSQPHESAAPVFPYHWDRECH